MHQVNVLELSVKEQLVNILDNNNLGAYSLVRQNVERCSKDLVHRAFRSLLKYHSQFHREAPLADKKILTTDGFLDPRKFTTGRTPVSFGKSLTNEYPKSR